jgi:hypothetical protein
MTGTALEREQGFVSIVDALVAAVRAGDPREARVAIRALAEVDDDRAREALGEALAGTGPLVELAIQALARHGARAQPIVVCGVAAGRWRGSSSPSGVIRRWTSVPTALGYGIPRSVELPGLRGSDHAVRRFTAATPARHA